MAVKYLVVLVCAVLAMFVNNLVNCVQEGLVSLYNLYFGRDVAVTLFRIDEALVCEGPVVTPADTASWWTGGIPLVAVVAGGAAACLTSLALAAWKIRRHEATRKQLLLEMEDLRKDNTCAVAEFKKREQELVSKTEELVAELRHRDQLVQDSLADGKRLKEDIDVLEETVLDMERLLEESRLSTEDLKTTYEDMIVDKEGQIEDLLAKEEKHKEDCSHLERKLLDALTNIEEMERRMKEEAELAVYRQTLIEGRDEQIQVLLAKEGEVQEACDRLERNLLEAFSRNHDMETLLEEKEREQKELKNLFENLIEKKDHQIQDLLAQEAEMKEASELLEGKVLDAVTSKMEMQRRLKEKEEQLTICQTEIEGKDEEIQALLTKGDEMHEACELLRRQLHNALSNKEDMERLLKEKEDEKTELVAFCETQIEEMEKVVKTEKEQNLEVTNIYEKRIEDLYVHIKDLLAEGGRLKEEKGQLAGSLEDALRNVEEMERVLKMEKEHSFELTIIYEKRIEDLYVHIKGLLTEGGRLKEEREHLAEKLRDTLNTVEELEELLKKEKDEKLELTISYEEMVDELFVSCKDLLAKEVEQKEEKELLEQKLEELLEKEKQMEKSKESLEDELEEALCSNHQMEKLWKEEQELKQTMEIKWQQAMQEKEEELKMWKQKCEESDVKERLRERTEKQNLEKLQELTENCEELQKKCQAAEEAKAKEELHNREWRRKQTEALRKQDKFLLMRLFNGISHRNNLLENTGKEEGERNEQENGSHQEYCCDQEEKTGYLKTQWSAVNNIVKDILKGQSSAEKSSSSVAGTSAIEDGSC